MSANQGNNHLEHLKRVAEDLGERFDAVQIIATVSEGQSSGLVAYGTGNVFARCNMAEVWAAKTKQKAVESLS